MTRHMPLVIDPALVYSTYIGGDRNRHRTGYRRSRRRRGLYQRSDIFFGFSRLIRFNRPLEILPDAYRLKINPAGDAIVFAP